MVTAEADHDALIAEHAVPFHGGDGDVGVLLCHGFTGTPWSLRAWGEHLAGDGFRVSVPLWPGHGTSWQDLNRTTWQEWYAAAEQELRELRQQCSVVCVGGLSMGGALALRLAQRFGSDVRALALVNPAISTTDRRFWVLPLLSRVQGSIPGIASDIARPGVDEYGYRRTPLRATVSMTGLWRDVRANLAQVHQPILLFRSREDHVVDPSSARLIRAGVSSDELTERELARSFHVATMDHDAEDIFVESAEFFRRHADG